jgi:hypothetical protein
VTRIALGLFVVWATCAPESPRSSAAKTAEAKAPEAKAPEAKAPEAKAPEAKAPADANAPDEETPFVGATTALEAKAPVDATPLPAFEEQLGGLKLGMTQTELQAVRPSLVAEGETVSFPPDGGPIDAIAGWQRELKDRETSVTLQSPTKDGVFRATTIWVESGTTATTKKGIALGAKRSAAKKAYPKARALVEDELYAKLSDHEQLWLGFSEGKVVRMMLGPPTDPDDIEE